MTCLPSTPSLTLVLWLAVASLGCSGDRRVQPGPPDGGGGPRDGQGRSIPKAEMAVASARDRRSGGQSSRASFRDRGAGLGAGGGGKGAGGRFLRERQERKVRSRMPRVALKRQKGCHGAAARRRPGRRWRGLLPRAEPGAASGLRGDGPAARRAACHAGSVRHPGGRLLAGQIAVLAALPCNAILGGVEVERDATTTMTTPTGADDDRPSATAHVGARLHRRRGSCIDGYGEGAESWGS